MVWYYPARAGILSLFLMSYGLGAWDLQTHGRFSQRNKWEVGVVVGDGGDLVWCELFIV